ncbi:MAG: exodeoxyribonuclease V subunit alpha [Syntrophales bacterium]|nr:exodeoxyribonuclease V subunit alpha [Syntrophales bacterium]
MRTFSELDLHFARFMTELAGRDSPEVSLAAALASRSTREGHICLDLSSIEGRPLTGGDFETDPIICPRLSHWRRILEASPVVGKPGDYKPLILDERSRLYLYRYWDYEEKLADFISDRTGDGAGEPERFSDKIDTSLLLKDGLDRLFPPLLDEGTDWQRVAAITSLLKRFSVISGSPGTGKTTTVAKIMALLLEQSKGKALRIALAAPTGKAAARLEEAIKKTREMLSCPDAIRAAIPEKATTIHRLLGTIPDSPYFLYNSENPLPVDVVIVDEASMVDLSLMSKLVQAIPRPARLILLGDKDQLASVEAGAVLGDICGMGPLHTFSREFSKELKKYTGLNGIQVASHVGETPGICDSLVQLQKNYRFGEESGIGHLASAVNGGDGDRALALLKSGVYKDIQWSELPRPDLLVPALAGKLINNFTDYLKAIDSEGNFEVIFDLFDEFRILCALRQGPFGASALNLLIEQTLRRENLIKPDTRWYRGRPIMITRNDYNLRLFNGDTGIILPDRNNELYAFFRDAGGAWRKFFPSRLPEHETVYAMTIHKSQGSEFDRVLLILSDRDSPVLTRELVYTGITRARKEVTIWGREDVFHTAVSRRIIRTSGLHDALWGF